MKLVFVGHLDVYPGGRDGRVWYKVIATGNVKTSDGETLLQLPYYEQYANAPVPSGDHQALPVRLVSRLDRKQARHIIEIRFD